MSDVTTIDSILNGQIDNYEILIVKYQRQLYSTILHLVKNVDSTEDIVQDSFGDKGSNLRLIPANTFLYFSYLLFNFSVIFLKL